MGLKIQQGDIFLVKLDPVKGHEIAKTRPCIVIQNDVLNEDLGTILVVPLTSKIFEKPYVNVVPITKNDSNLNRPGSAKVEQLRFVDKSRVLRKIGRVDTNIILQLRRRIALIVGNFNEEQIAIADSLS